MDDEFGTTEYGNDGGYSNSGLSKDNPNEKPNPAPEEYHDYSGMGETSGTKERKKSPFRTALRSLSAVAVAAVAIVTFIPVFPFFKREKATANFEYLSAADGVLEYSLSFTDWDKNDVSILINTAIGYTLYEQPVESETVSGSLSGLREGYGYEVVVKSGRSTVASRSVTMSASPVKRTEYYGIVYECQCALDGFFHFTLSLIDENGYWTDFSATLEDAYGNRAECGFDDPTAEQTLAVSASGLMGKRATLRVFCATTEPDENGNTDAREHLFFEGEVSI